MSARLGNGSEALLARPPEPDLLIKALGPTSLAKPLPLAKLLSYRRTQEPEPFNEITGLCSRPSLPDGQEIPV